MTSIKEALEKLNPDQVKKICNGLQDDMNIELNKSRQTLDEIDKNIYSCIIQLKKLRRCIVISHFGNMKNNASGQKNKQRDAILKSLECEDEAKDLSVFMKNLNNMPSTSKINSEPVSNVELISKSINILAPSINFSPPTGLIDLAYVIGNTVKVSDSEDEMKYKWTVYVRNVEEGLDNLMYIDKVRYFLHESYEPNHIVDVVQKPFSLTRHGWGEFVIRLRLYFKGNMNVQTDVYHKLTLDKGLVSGIPMVAKEQTVQYKLLLHK